MHLDVPVARVESDPGHRRLRPWPAKSTERSAVARRATQELGRLPWFALLFFRAFFLRAFFAMLTSSGAGRCPPAASAAVVAYRSPGHPGPTR